MEFKYLFTYANARHNLYGWKIFDTLEEIEQIKEYFKNRPNKDLFINEKTTVKYSTYDALIGDTEVLPISVDRVMVLLEAFDVVDTFGVFPLA